MVINSDASVEKYATAQTGFKSSLALPVRELDLGDRVWRLEEIEDVLYDEYPDLVYCVGAKAYLVANRFISEKDIVFSSIINWQRLPLTKKTYGVSNELLPEMQTMLFRHVFPGVQRIGVLYSEEYNGQWVEQAGSRAKDMGVEIIGNPIRKNEQAVSAVEALLENVDALILVLVCSVFVHPGHCKGQDHPLTGVSPHDDALEEEFRWLKAETYVITASRVTEEINKSAASITVITDKQLGQMGAVDLLDALARIVPGVEYWTSVEDIELISVNGQVPHAGILFLINNHPVNDVQNGASYNFNDMMIDNIQRIEFIRGPGSALYGANAFHGVINVITKSAEEIDGIELGVRGGSWDTRQYNLLGGKRVGELEIAGNLNYYKTHGFRGIILEDVQTELDRLYSSGGVPYQVSRAPGYTNGGQEKYDATLNLKLKGFDLDVKYLDKEWHTPSQSEIKDIISAEGAQPRVFTNRGSSRSHSIEMEMAYDFGRGTYLAGNLTYIDQESGLKEKYYIEVFVFFVSFVVITTKGTETMGGIK